MSNIVVVHMVMRAARWLLPAHSPHNNNNNNNKIKNNVRLLNCWTYRAINNTNIRHAGRETTAATQVSAIYIRVKPAKLLPHMAHSGFDQPHRLDLVNIHQMARPAHIR